MASTRPDPSSLSPASSVPDKLDAALRALLKFQPSSQASVGRRPDRDRGEWNPAAEAFIHLATEFVVALEDTPGGLALLQAKVTEVLRAFNRDQPLRGALDALDALLGQKLQQLEEQRSDLPPGTVVFDNLAWDIPIASRVLIKFCQANDMDVRKGGQLIPPPQQQAIRSRLGKVLPHGKRTDRVAIQDFALTLGISVQDIRDMLRRADMEEKHAGFVDRLEQNTVACIQKMPQTQVKGFELARQLDLTDKQLLDVCRRIGIDIKNQLSDVSLAHQNVVRAFLTKADNDPAAVPDISTVTLDRRVLESDRASIAKLQHWLDNPVLPFAGEQILNFARQSFPAFTSEEAAAVVHPLREQAWQLVQLARDNHYLGGRMLMECRETPRPYEKQRELLGRFADLATVVPAVQQAAESLCTSMRSGRSVQVVGRYVFRSDSHDDDRFHIRFEEEEGRFDHREGLVIIHALLQTPNPEKPRTAVAILRGSEESKRAERSHWTEKRYTENDLKAMRETLRALHESTKATAIEDADELEKILRDSVKNPKKFLEAGEDPIPKFLGTTTEQQAKDLIRKHFKLACNQLAKKMPRLVQHLETSMRPKRRQPWAYRPDRHIPWQLD